MPERARAQPAVRNEARIAASPTPAVLEQGRRAGWDDAQQSLGNQGVLRASARGVDAPGSSVIVDDMAASVAPGQMRRRAFLAALQEAVFAATEPDLSRAGRTARDCPYIHSVLQFYSGRDASHLHRAVLRHAPETRWASTAGDYIALVSERARHAAGVWAATGRIEWRTHEFAALQAQMGPGHPLEGRIRAKAESSMHEDFAGVRVHTDGEAAALSRRFEARAFTIGEDIAFAPGQYRPGTLEGDAILAHELAHVAQQRQGGGGAVQRDESPELERDADQAAAGTVMSIWGAASAAFERVKPALRTGLRVQRCKEARGPQGPVASGPLSFLSSNFVMEADGPVTIADLGAAVQVQSSEVFSSGTVTASGGTDAEARDWKAGYLQTVFASHRVAEYVDSSGAHNNSFEVKLPGPTRDGTSDVVPWYNSGKPPQSASGSPVPVSAGTVSRFRATGTSVFPYLTDTPGMPAVPWKTPDGAGTLARFSGQDRFGTWLVVRQESTAEIRWLNFAEWGVDWAGTASFATKQTAGSPNGTRLKRSGKGKGSKEPVLVNPVARDAATCSWEKGANAGANLCGASKFGAPQDRR